VRPSHSPLQNHLRIQLGCYLGNYHATFGGVDAGVCATVQEKRESAKIGDNCGKTEKSIPLLKQIIIEMEKQKQLKD